VTGGEFLRRLKKLAKRNGVAFAFVPDEGKESHGRIYYGPAFATLKDRKKEIGSGLLADMCRQLKINTWDLR
jgi:hypothetical protein